MKDGVNAQEEMETPKQNILLPIFVLFAIALLCVLWIVLQKQEPQDSMVLSSYGEILLELDLDQVDDLTYQVVVDGKTNTIHIDQGKAAVVFSNCPDQICVNQGYNNEKSIICLPHQLIIRFHSQEESYDAFSG